MVLVELQLLTASIIACLRLSTCLTWAHFELVWNLKVVSYRFLWCLLINLFPFYFILLLLTNDNSNTPECTQNNVCSQCRTSWTRWDVCLTVCLEGSNLHCIDLKDIIRSYFICFIIKWFTSSHFNLLAKFLKLFSFVISDETESCLLFSYALSKPRSNTTTHYFTSCC
jgi:hypothetical protein